jgi:hypothetical protein
MTELLGEARLGDLGSSTSAPPMGVLERGRDAGITAVRDPSLRAVAVWPRS